MSSSSPISSTVGNLSISAATAVSRSWNCACGPSCALFIDHRCASQSGATGRLALPGFWMVFAIALVCWFVLVSGTVGSSPETPQNVDGGHARAPVPTLTTSVFAVNEEAPSSTIIYHPLAGHLLPEKVEIKRSEPEAKHAIDKATTNIPPTYPGATRIAILLALLLLSAMLIPMALADPVSTSMTYPSLSLPSPSPCTTAFNATGTALCIDLQQKDKPQSWYWIPPNSSDRTSIDSLLSLIPFLLMGFFFMLPSFVAGELEKDIKIIDDMVVTKRDTAPSSASPVWIIDFSTTTVWPPASTVTEPRGVSSTEPTEKPIGVAGNGVGCGPGAEMEICTEANPAVCPIVLGRKPWTPV